MRVGSGKSRKRKRTVDKEVLTVGKRQPCCYGGRPRYLKLVEVLGGNGWLLRDLCGLVYEFAQCRACDYNRCFRDVDVGKCLDLATRATSHATAPIHQFLYNFNYNSYQINAVIETPVGCQNYSADMPGRISVEMPPEFTIRITDAETISQLFALQNHAHILLRNIISTTHTELDPDLVHLLPIFHQTQSQTQIQMQPASVIAAESAMRPIWMKFTWPISDSSGELTFVADALKKGTAVLADADVRKTQTTCQKRQMVVGVDDESEDSFTSDGELIHPFDLKVGDHVSLIFDFPWAHFCKPTIPCLDLLKVRLKLRLEKLWLYSSSN
jgi:hypothetical protein